MRDKVNMRTSSTNTELADNREKIKAKQNHQHQGNVWTLKETRNSSKTNHIDSDPAKVLTNGVMQWNSSTLHGSTMIIVNG